MPLEFEWDASKAAINLKKHSAGFDEACSVFDDPLAAIFRDEDHSIEEVREIVIGNSIRGRLMLVCFMERSEGVIRIFSARAATKRERGAMKTTSDNTTGPKKKGPAPSAARVSGHKAGDLRNEYKFDYSSAQPNRFAGRRGNGQVVVLLDPDVARVFTSPAAVNSALRAILTAIPSDIRR